MEQQKNPTNFSRGSVNYRQITRPLSDFGIFPPKAGEMDKMKKIKAKEIKLVPEGVHQGSIVAVLDRDEPYAYVDLIVRPADYAETDIKVGFPANISASSGLGLLLARFGINVKVGEEYDVEKLLLHKKISFMTINEKSEKGTFARIIKDSIKPV